MLIEYTEEALRRATYELIDDEEPYYGELRVWATGRTLEECRNNLKGVIEGWMLLSIKKNIPISKFG
ncbi:MAG: type II toxin-antitoxin system HicB family antitoxin [bacterium]